MTDPVEKGMVTLSRATRQRAQRRNCACRIRSRPSAVHGPVDRPPWNLHRPLANAFARHGVPFRVLAPHSLFWRDETVSAVTPHIGRARAP